VCCPVAEASTAAWPLPAADALLLSPRRAPKAVAFASPQRAAAPRRPTTSSSSTWAAAAPAPMPGLSSPRAAGPSAAAMAAAAEASAAGWSWAPARAAPLSSPRAAGPHSSRSSRPARSPRAAAAGGGWLPQRHGLQQPARLAPPAAASAATSRRAGGWDDGLYVPEPLRFGAPGSKAGSIAGAGGLPVCARTASWAAGPLAPATAARLHQLHQQLARGALA
jgi:hypothetical protein